MIKSERRIWLFFLDCVYRLGGVNASAGLRYEDVYYDFYENSLYQSDESKHYRNLFPSLSLEGAMGQVQWALGVSYSGCPPSL